jgi:hypothetical protein
MESLSAISGMRTHSETDFKNMRAEALDEFVSDVARGTNLRFIPKGGHP